MPQKRGSNAANKGKTNPQSNIKHTTIQHGSVQSDIVGVVLAVLAIALLVSLVVPSGAVVTSAVSQGLSSLFGVGAILAPISIFLFSLTFFVDGEEPFGARVALGLALVCLAILSLFSLFVPGADANPLVVLDTSVVSSAGGFVGGGVAWTLLSLVGLPVGCVALIGLALSGVIVCGFSMSKFVKRVQQGAVRLHNSRTRAREQLAFATASDQAVMANAEQQVEFDEALDAPRTTFIGTRTTTVLTRGRARKSRMPVTDPLFSGEGENIRDKDSREDQPRTLRRKPVPTKDVRGNEDEGTGNIPDFLRNPKSAGAQSELDPKPSTTTSGAKKKQTQNKPRPGRGANSAAKKNYSRPEKDPARTQRSTAKPAAISRPGEGMEGYELPPLDMLSSNPNSSATASSIEELNETKLKLQGTLHEFGLTSRVVDYVSGPIVTTFRVEMGEGERVSRIRNLEDDIALTLAAEKVRIFAPIPGTSFVGIEIPNHTRQNVHLGDVLPTATGGPLEVAIGRDSSGRPVVADIAKMPHMLVAGTTGSGKSVMINSMIMSLLMRTTPKQVRLIMIDPKRVEFSCYNGLPHLYVPVVTEPRQAASALQWAVSEMERRLRVFERAGAREIKVYNEMCVSGKLSEMEHPPEPMPYLVVIIDELSDLMMVAGKDVEASIVRIAQLARAAGIHLVIATQRPSANVVTGLIKSNIDNRVALKVSSGIDSRVILDETGAERLLGNGDMLFKYRGLNMQRVLGCYTSDSEINEVVDFIRDQAEPDYHEEILTAVVPGTPAGASRASDADADDPLIWEAAQIVVESRLGSTSGLQRRLKVGYSRAGRIMDMLEAKGVVGPPDGSKPREVLLDEEGLEELRVQDAAYREVM